ncbi:MAG: aminotransferase class I/II-fold pyridoxal phosphate-dependent enzyme [Candidatus Eremiobacteraeota bacterium]|nr:aminotransferase class I/II-fold pyridoxal phosphate-dependent enzyme [Candidatus Eremiobacteraeota bacterium]
MASSAFGDEAIASSRDLALLCASIGEGAHVLEIGGRDRQHARALAERGYRVTSVACEPFASGERPAADRIDAAICLQPPRWRDDAEVMRLLRAVRDALADDGLLILARANRRTTTDLDVLVRTAGFDVVRSPSPAWILAEAAPRVPDALALRAHHDRSEAALNLRWSPDEIDFLAPGPDAIWAPLLAENVANVAREYALSDPWGSERGAPAISSFFGVAVAPESVVFGAGAAGLLRQLAPLVRAGRLLTTAYVHRDFPLWAMAEGAEIRWLADDRDEDGIRAAADAAAAHVLYLDRPSATGAVINLDSLARLCAHVRRHHGLVLVDEAYLAYFAGANSAVSLVPSVDNLVVIRSMSKAYCAGGLRVGFAVGGGLAREAFRRLVAPLQVSELAFRMGLRLLGAGDVFVRLRARIAGVKREMTSVLARAGLEVVAGHDELPWVLVDDPAGGVQTELVARGIAGKRLVPFTAASGSGFLRLAVPLSDERVEHFRRAMNAPS